MTPTERTELIADIAAAIHIRSSDVGLTTEEERWVRQAIQGQAQAIALRRAVIEKTLAGLVWAVVIGFGAVMLEYLRGHGFK